MAGKQKVIALTTIHRTTKPGKAADPSKGTLAQPPEIEVLKPGTLFMTRSQEEFDELLGADAVRVQDEDGGSETEAHEVAGKATTEDASKSTAADTAAPKATKAKGGADEGDLV